ncbi:UV radiation resistance associated protein [Neolecta irregularis DAH-3]|uniref:UV radiation resistance associated protein n=1 Tax=Neolecta irregularis (strain DAH-3) TaxID=1198029 RepID=A0A1U7LNZ9_NEOID|nr:UV radiation resistance associated protein [Neolecta irregularis DAH-3]|eukprot:OLL24377.1 UV radiation resistance associated protein [Neolecta irregularis DAH-3]
MAHDSRIQLSTLDHLTQARHTLSDRKKTKSQISTILIHERKRIVHLLSDIYPIDPIPHSPLHFKIRGLFLPNSVFIDHDTEIVAAALGFTAHLVYLLAFYLEVPLRYPIHPLSGHASIQDPITIMTTKRTFPLFEKHVDQQRFEYAVYLLNKNIEQENSIALHV